MLDSNLLQGIWLFSLGFTFWLLAVLGWKVSNLRSKSKTVNQDYISILISGSDKSQGKTFVLKKKSRILINTFDFPCWTLTDEGVQAQERVCVSGCFFLCVFFLIFVNMHGIFCTQATQEQTRAHARRHFENINQSLLLLRNERQAEQFISDRNSLQSQQLARAPTRVHAAALTATVSFGTLADAHTHTHFYTERGIKRKKVRDYRIRSQYNTKLDYIAFNQVTLFYRAVTFSIWWLNFARLKRLCLHYKSSTMKPGMMHVQKHLHLFFFFSI